MRAQWAWVLASRNRLVGWWGACTPNPGDGSTCTGDANVANQVSATLGNTAQHKLNVTALWRTRQNFDLGMDLHYVSGVYSSAGSGIWALDQARVPGHVLRPRHRLMQRGVPGEAGGGDARRVGERFRA